MNAERSDAPVGVFDSGLGGLSVVRAIRAALPQEHLLYYADSLHAPYGPRDDAFIIERSLAISDLLLAQGAKAIVVACNTATAAAVAALRSRVRVPVVGVEPGLKPAAALTRTGVVGVLATASTLASTRFHALLQRVQQQSGSVRFVTAVGQGWVELIERGDLHSGDAARAVARVVRPLLAEQADTLVLGCTHYPFFAPLIERCLREEAHTAQLIDTAPAIARELLRRLTQESSLRTANAPGTLELMSSGSTEAWTALARLLLDR